MDTPSREQAATGVNAPLLGGSNSSPHRGHITLRGILLYRLYMRVTYLCTPCCKVNTYFTLRRHSYFP